MALVVKDRVQVSTSTTGTGTLTLGVALGGFQDFSVIGDGNTTYYAITNNGEWEVGIGTYTASGTTLSRDTVLESSNSGNKINLSGTSAVFCTYPAEKGLYLDANGNAIGLGTPASVNLTNATNLPLTTGVTGVLPQANGGTGTTVGYNGFKNRIINGAMMIDQRNAGASVTINSAGYTYTVDRWGAYGQATDGVYTMQRSTTAPAGFVNSLLATVTTADASIGASQFYVFRQPIEGLNVADLNWGTANAATVTLSFWVRSSLTGTFSGSLTNRDYNRSYPFTYTISSANTWEQKSITIAGDTTGTWATDNTVGINVYIDLGSGSSTKGTAGAWTGSGLVGVTGSVNLIGTSGATFYITGVQLEKGSTATSFDYRPYGAELALCQRYFQLMPSDGPVVAAQPGTNSYNTSIPLPVVMRVSPTCTATVGGNNANMSWWEGSNARVGTLSGLNTRNVSLSLAYPSPSLGSAGVAGLSTSGPTGSAFLISAEL
jgi:hypothetical protein